MNATADATKRRILSTKVFLERRSNAFYDGLWKDSLRPKQAKFSPRQKPRTFYTKIRKSWLIGNHRDVSHSLIDSPIVLPKAAVEQEQMTPSFAQEMVSV